MTRAARVLLGMVGALFLLASCGGESGVEAEGEILVSAAASLTDAFVDVEAAFEDTYPNTDVILNIAGSSTLREQILEEAPVDVFASADTKNMDAVVAVNATYAEPAIFALNRMQIVVPAGNPGDVAGLADFANEDLVVGLCAPEVPCGDFARMALENAGVEAALDTNEPDVRALLTKIEAGELDAGIGYVTDVTAAAATVDGIDIPEAENVTAEYPIAILAEAPNRESATRFKEFILSEDGQTILGTHGFDLP